MITAQAPGKMILLGEYAVLEGAPALVCAVDRYAVVEVEENTRNEFSVASPSLDISEEPFVMNDRGKIRFDPNLDEDRIKRLQFFKTIFEEAWQFINREKGGIPPLRIILNTDDFYSVELKSKFGFGSSAAMTVALIQALKISANSSLLENEKSELFRLAFKTHRKAQGNIGSGIDIAASTFGGVLLYELTLDKNSQQKIPQPLDVWQDLFILPIWSGRSASTRRMVSGVDELKKTKPAAYQTIFDELKKLSQFGSIAYKERDIKTFLETVKSFHQTLAQLGERSGMPIISPVHQKLASVVENQGGVYKPSGAGGGDIGIAFAESPERIETIAKAVGLEGYGALNISIASKGVHIKSP